MTFGALANLVVAAVAAAAMSGCAGTTLGGQTPLDPGPAPEFAPVKVSGLAPCSALPLNGRASDVDGDVLPDLSLPCLTSGRSIAMADLAGRPVLVNLWATWCGPCREEMPRLQAAYEEYGDRVMFLGVDTQDFPEAAGEFLAEVGVTYPQVADPEAELLDFTRVPGLPVTLLLDSEGVIVDRHIGELKPGDIEELLSGVS